MPLLPAVLALPPGVAAALETSVKPKFEAYFSFTKTLMRSHPGPQGGYIYPNDSLMSDLVVLAALYSEVVQAFDDHCSRAALADTIKADAYLTSQVLRIVQGSRPDDLDGAFWEFDRDSTAPVDLRLAVSSRLQSLLRTMRNGFAHFHWRYDNLSSLDYWKAQSWSTANSKSAFGLERRPPKNYMAYIADARAWDPGRFWALEDLRIVVTPYGVLRYHLFSLVSYLVSGTQTDIFGNPP